MPYQPPEMFSGLPFDARSADVWALGCMLYELLTGNVMFPGQGDCLRPTMPQVCGSLVVLNFGGIVLL